MNLKRSCAWACVVALIASPTLADISSPVRATGPGTAPVSCTIASATTCGPYSPRPGLFHVQLNGAASASCVLERQLDGSTWTNYTVTANGTTTQMGNWTVSGAVALSEDFIESQTGVLYRVDCGVQSGSYTSGSLGVRFSQ